MTVAPVNCGGRRKFLTALVLSLSVLIGSREVVAGPAPTVAPGRQLLIAVDLSGSRSEAALIESSRLLRKLVEGLEPRDEIVLIRMEARGQQPGNAWPFELPTVKHSERPSSIERKNLDGAREDINDAARRLFAQAKDLRKSGTDILSTLFKVSDYVQRSGTKSVSLILLSDMIHDSNGRSFEKEHGIPSPSWIAQQGKMERLPGLQGVCVSAVGPDPSTAIGVRVRRFWQEYFRAVGAQFSAKRYRQSVTRIEDLRCDEPQH